MDDPAVPTFSAAGEAALNLAKCIGMASSKTGQPPSIQPSMEVLQTVCSVPRALLQLSALGSHLATRLAALHAGGQQQLPPSLRSAGCGLSNASVHASVSWKVTCRCTSMLQMPFAMLLKAHSIANFQMRKVHYFHTGISNYHHLTSLYRSFLERFVLTPLGFMGALIKTLNKPGGHWRAALALSDTGDCLVEGLIAASRCGGAGITTTDSYWFVWSSPPVDKSSMGYKCSHNAVSPRAFINLRDTAPFVFRRAIARPGQQLKAIGQFQELCGICSKIMACEVEDASSVIPEDVLPSASGGKAPQSCRPGCTHRCQFHSGAAPLLQR